MRDQSNAGQTPQHWLLATVVSVGRIVLDLVVITIIVFGLALLFLYTGWPRWTFYGLLFGLVVLYTAVTKEW